MQVNSEESIEIIGDALVIILSMLSTSELLKVMVIIIIIISTSLFSHPISLFKTVCKRWFLICKHEHVLWEHRTIRAPEQPERYHRMLSSLADKHCFVQHLDVSGMLCIKTHCFTYQVK